MPPPALLPMLAGGAGIPPDPGNWLMEAKFDGQRILATVAAGATKLATRRGIDATAAFPELAGLAGALSGRSAVLDGEVVALDAGGRPSFQRLQRRMNVLTPGARLLAETPVAYAVFDLLWLDGELLVRLPQAERRRLLDELGLRGPFWQTAPVLDAAPEELLEACRRVGFEGFMAKRLDAPYQPGRRSPAWSKVKCGRRRELVVGGWTPGKGWRRTSIGALAVGCYDVTPEEAGRRGRPAELLYVGRVGSGLSEDLIGRLAELFTTLSTGASPFAGPVPPGVRFVEPALVVEVAYAGATDSGTLRQPSLKGLRTDLLAAEVVVDEELAAGFEEP